jgi:hypothetical protein
MKFRARSSMPRTPVFSFWKIFQSCDMKRVKCGDLAIRVQDRKRISRKQNEFGMMHRIFMPIRSADGERLESARHSLPNTLYVHVDCLNHHQMPVNLCNQRRKENKSGLKQTN